MVSTRDSLMAALVALGALAGTHQLQAQEASYEMTAYANQPGGPALLAGRYEAAIDQASQRAPRADNVAALGVSTTRCVAHTIQRNFPEAYDACEAAVSLAERVDARPGSLIRRTEATARALTNRGVLRAVSGNVLGAAMDFRRASQLGGGIEAPSRNLARLERTPGYRLALAQN